MAVASGMAGGSAEPNAVATRWRLTEELFHRAMELPAPQRMTTLSEWCGYDTALLTAVLELIEADSAVEDLISSAPAAEPGKFLNRETTGDLTGEGRDTEYDAGSDPWIGRVLGAFRLQTLLGRGGMGVVYLGDRVSGGFSQKVAVKLVGRHLRTTPAVEQFLLERETLAKLEHANIARLLDGGVTEEGFPYLVMEFVEGRRLDAACDDPATTVEQVLQWMLQLCWAVTYVHRNLILHRDLKPGNVMVTAEGQVKLLDFGTLKRIGQAGETGDSLNSPMTQAGMRPVTLRYASPEHIEGSAVTTATDVYSLGMMLYRLVAGRLPEGLDDLPIGQYLERLEAGGFKPPSRVLRDAQGSRKMVPQIGRDLDAIVAKALRAEPGLRYATAGALAEDLTNVLALRPVSAREGTFQYRAAKFYRRNRKAVLAAAAVFLVLACGLTAMAWQGHVAHVEELRAEKGVEDERGLAHMLLFDYFEQLTAISGSVEAQRKAVTQALGYLDRLAVMAPGSSLELETIRGYTDMGSLLGNPYDANLGNRAEATRTLEKGLALAQARVQRYPNDLPSLQALAKVYLAIGGVYLGNGDAGQGENYLRAGADISARMAKNPKVDGASLDIAASLLDNLGDAYDPGRGFATADMQKAMDTYLLSDEYDEMCEKVDPANSMCRFGLPVGQYKFGMLVEETDPALAAAHYRQGLISAEQLPAEEQKKARTQRLRDYLGSRLALMEIETGHMTDGATLGTRVQESFRNVIRQDKDTVNTRTIFDLVAIDTDLGSTYHRYGKDREAEEPVREALAELKKLLTATPNNVRWQMIQAQNWMTYGDVESKIGHSAIASDAWQHGLDEALQLSRNKDASPEMLVDTASYLLQLHKHPGDAQLALEFAQRAADAYANPTAEQLLTLAKAEAAVGRTKDANKTAQLTLAALAGPVKSKVVADEIAEARALTVR